MSNETTSRRNILKGAALGAVAASLPASAQAQARPGIFICAHGTNSGGYSFDPVASRLRAMGHYVIADGLTGLGERTHLNGPNVNLTTHVMDIVNEVKYKELNNVVLVGHYGGFVITGAAEHIADRVGSIVYVDAMVPNDGESLGMLVRSFKNAKPGVDVGPEPLPANASDEVKRNAWKHSPQPIGTVLEKLHVTGAYERIPKKTYIRATEHLSENFDRISSRLRKDASWRVLDFKCEHNVMRAMPEELTKILVESIPA